MKSVDVYRRNTKTTSVNAYIAAIVMILAGMVLLTKSIAVGLLFILIATFALSLTEGLQIDFTNQRIRIFSGFFGLRFGQWESLPMISRITLVEVNQKYSMSGRTNLTTEVSVCYAQVRLYPAVSTDYYLASNGKLTSAQADAIWLAKHFGLPYEDYTSVTNAL